jgi:hypothetical protein
MLHGKIATSIDAARLRRSTYLEADISTFVGPEDFA